MITLERVYSKDTEGKGYRVLVDRLWPRGVKKDGIDLWLKEVAPSTDLRKWYGHEPDKWPDFKKKYFAELKANPEPVRQLLDIAGKKDVVLLYSSKEEKINNAVALKEYLDKSLIK